MNLLNGFQIFLLDSTDLILLVMHAVLKLSAGNEYSTVGWIPCQNNMRQRRVNYIFWAVPWQGQQFVLRLTANLFSTVDVESSRDLPLTQPSQGHPSISSGSCPSTPELRRRQEEAMKRLATQVQWGVKYDGNLIL